MAEPDDLGGEVTGSFAASETERLRRLFEPYAGEPPEPTPGAVAGPLGAGGAVARDIGLGIVGSPVQVVGGMRDAVQETLGAIDSVGNWLDENVVDLSNLTGAEDVQRRSVEEGFNAFMPNVPESETVTGNIIRGISQFATGFIPSIKLLRGMRGGAVATGLGRFAEAETAAALSSALVFDPHEERLSDLLNQFPMLQNPVFEYLSASPDDSEIEGRFKSAVEGLGLGALGELLYRGVRAIRVNRLEKGSTSPRRFTAIRADEQPPNFPADVSYDIMDRTGKEVGYAELEIKGDTAYVNIIDTYAPSQVGGEVFGPNSIGPREMRGLVERLIEDYPDVRFISGERISGAREAVRLEKADTPSRKRIVDYFTRGEEADEALTAADQEFVDSIEEATRSMSTDDIVDYVTERLPVDEEIPTSVVSISRFLTRELGEPEEPIATAALGHPDEPLIAREFLEGEQLSLDTPFQYNWSRFSSTEDIQAAINDTAQLFTEQIDEARRGRITDEETRRLADALGTTPEEMLARNRGVALTAEQILAERKVLEAASTHLQELARAARYGSDEDVYAFRRMLQIHSAIQAQFQGAASEAGRALRALQLAPGSFERQMQQVTELLMREGGPNASRRLATAIAEINDPNEIARAVRGSMGKRLTDAVIEAYYFNLLSGPQTHAVNFLSNGLFTLMQVPERYLAAGIGALRGAERTVAAAEAGALMHGMLEAQRSALRLAWRAILYGEGSQFTKLETRVPEAITSEKFPAMERWFGPFGRRGIDALGAVIRSPGRALMAMDEYYKEIGRVAETRAFSFRKATQEGLEGEAFARRVRDLMQNPTANIVDSAQAFGETITFTRQLGQRGRSVQRFINSIPVLRFLAPFVRTPGNLFKEAGHRTPLGVLSSSVRQEIRGGGPNADLAMARIGLGSLVAMTFADYALRGYITGAGPVDPDLRRTWRRTHQPFSIRVGDEWYSYNRFDPFGLFLGASASYAELAAYADQDTRDNLAWAITVATSQSVLSKTWLRTPAELAEALFSGEEGAFNRFVQRQMGVLLMPTGAAQVARIVDPVWHEVDSIMDAVRARTPGYSQTLPVSRNLWGQKILLEGGLGPDIVSPIYKSHIEDRPIDEWMLANRVNVRMPRRVQSFDGVTNIELTDEQYSRFVELAGNELKSPLTGLGTYDALNAIIEGRHPLSAAWERLTDGPEGTRSSLVRELIMAAREGARAQLLQEFPELRSRIRLRTDEQLRSTRETVMEPTAGDAP